MNDLPESNNPDLDAIDPDEWDPDDRDADDWDTQGDVECLPEIDDEPEPDLRDFYFERDEEG
jgi:hypothetical protein